MIKKKKQTPVKKWFKILQYRQEILWYSLNNKTVAVKVNQEKEVLECRKEP